MPSPRLSSPWAGPPSCWSLSLSSRRKSHEHEHDGRDPVGERPGGAAGGQRRGAPRRCRGHRRRPSPVAAGAATGLATAFLVVAFLTGAFFGRRCARRSGVLPRFRHSPTSARAGVILPQPDRRARGISPVLPDRRPGRLGPGGVEVLQELVGGELDVLVVPLGGSVDAGDEARTGAPGGGRRTRRRSGPSSRRWRLGEAEVPGGVVVPRVGVEEGVLVVGGRLRVAPVAREHVLAGIDQLAAVLTAALFTRYFAISAWASSATGWSA